MAVLDITRTPWIGHVNGTFVGNAFAEFSPAADGAIDLTLRVKTAETIVVLVGRIAVNDQAMSARLTTHPPIEDPLAVVDLIFTLLTQERIECRWQAGDGNAGTLQLVPAPLRLPQADVPAQNDDIPPIQVIQSTRQLPKITIYRDDLQDLSRLMKTWLKSNFDVVIRAEIDGQDVRSPAPAFWERTLPHRTDYISLWLSEPGPMPRSINVNLSPGDCSYTVTGFDSVWVDGTLERVSRVLGRKHGWWKSFYEKHLLKLNAVAMLLAIALAPSLNLPSRILLLGGTMALAIAIKCFHDKTTALKVYLKADYKPTATIDLPRLLTGLASAALIGGVGWVYKLLAGGGLASFLAWLAAP